MRTVKTLKPGQDGTKELLKRFGPSLLNVRYRYDEDRREHVKTVELVVQRRSRDGEAECLGSPAPDARASPETGSVSSSGNSGARIRRVALRIGLREGACSSGSSPRAGSGIPQGGSGICGTTLPNSSTCCHGWSVEVARDGGRGT